MVTILANNVVVDEEDPDSILIGFEQTVIDPRRYIIVQRSYEFDDQDIELGMNQVYIERDDQGWSAYGGVLLFKLEREKVLVTLDLKTAEILGGESNFEIQFDLDDQHFTELRNGLIKVFKDFDSLLVSA